MLDRIAFADRPPNARSKVTNGVRLHQKGLTDGRSRESRRFHDLCSAFAAEFGELAQSEARRTLIRNAAFLALRSEQIQALAVMGKPIDSEEAVRLANASARLMAALKRGRERKVAPSIAVADIVKRYREGA